jgi:hypothetical protein
VCGDVGLVGGCALVWGGVCVCMCGGWGPSSFALIMHIMHVRPNANSNAAEPQTDLRELPEVVGVALVWIGEVVVAGERPAHDGEGDEHLFKKGWWWWWLVCCWCMVTREGKRGDV